MIDNPLEMVKGLVILAPELNMKIALLNLIDYIDEKIDIDEDEDMLFRIEDIVEIIASSLVRLHHHVGDDGDDEYETDDGFGVGGQDYTDSPITDDEVEKFKKLLGIIPDNESKEETNE